MASSLFYCFRYFIALIMSRTKIKIKYILKKVLETFVQPQQFSKNYIFILEEHTGVFINSESPTDNTLQLPVLRALCSKYHAFVSVYITFQIFKSYLWISSYSKYLTPDILKASFTERAPLLLSKTNCVLQNTSFGSNLRSNEIPMD